MDVSAALAQMRADGLDRLSIPQYRRLKDLVLKWMPVSHNKAIDGEAPEQGKQGGTPLLFALLARCALCRGGGRLLQLY